jgi:hypothetical protein
MVGTRADEEAKMCMDAGGLHVQDKAVELISDQWQDCLEHEEA